MARKRRGPNWRRYLSGAINLQLEIGTLGGKVAVKENLPQTVVDTTRISSLRAVWALENWTPIADVGPIMVGVAHSDYTNAEIEAFIEAASSWDFGDKIAKEVRSRLVRIVGVLNTPDSVTQSTHLNDGKPIRTKLNWLLAEGDTLAVWAYNQGDGTVATTIPNVQCFGTANLWVV